MRLMLLGTLLLPLERYCTNTLRLKTPSLLIDIVCSVLFDFHNIILLVGVELLLLGILFVLTRMTLFFYAFHI